MTGRSNAEEFLSERRWWLRVEAIDRPNGGWDVMLRLDGTYSDETWVSKEEMVAFFKHRLGQVLGAVTDPSPRVRHSERSGGDAA